MDPAHGGDQLLEGWRALEAARWDVARAAFEASLAVEETAEAHDGLGQALWFLGAVEEAIAARERAFERVRARREMRRRRARRRVGLAPVLHLGTRLGRARLAVPRGARARRRRALRGARLGGGGARAARGERGGVRRARAARDGDRAGVGRRRPRGVRAQPPGAGRGQRRAPAGGDAAARGGHGGGHVRARPQRPHARRGLLQPDHGVHERGRVGTRRGVVRARRRFRSRARRDAAARRLPHRPRGRPARHRPLARGGARAGERACGARPLRADDGRADHRRDGGATRPPGPPAGGRAAARRPRSSIRRRCARSPIFASPRVSRRWPPRCWSAG